MFLINDNAILFNKHFLMYTLLLYSPAVSFCGYTVPHPMERKIHVRIQTNKVPAVQVLRQALKELKEQNEFIRQMIKVSK